MDEIVGKIVQYVNTGEVRTGGIETLLNSGAIGSCIVLIGFDSKRRIGSMAHVMLPDSAPTTNQLNATKYAANALDELLSQFDQLKVDKGNLQLCIVGGANVLKRENDTIGESNIRSVEKLLQQKGLKIGAKSVGGYERRTVLFDIEKGCIYYTLGDSKQQILWQTVSKHTADIF